MLFYSTEMRDGITGYLLGERFLIIGLLVSTRSLFMFKF